MTNKTTISVLIKTKNRFNDSKNKRSGKEIRSITANDELEILLNKGECK